MKKLMLIDASDPAETRVVVTKDDRVEEFDREIRSHAQIKGNIFLAKVTRVEPSLQAAFVDYGGNRHGFLPFSEIHPDYYRIPVADREALLAEEAAIKAASEEDDDEDDRDEPDESPHLSARESAAEAGDFEAEEPETAAEEGEEPTADTAQAAEPVPGEEAAEAEANPVAETAEATETADAGPDDRESEHPEAEAEEPAAPVDAEEETVASEPAAAAPEEPESTGTEEEPEAPVQDGSGSERSMPMVAKSGDQITGTPEEAAAAEAAEQAPKEDPADDAELPSEPEAAEEPADAEAGAQASPVQETVTEPEESAPAEDATPSEPEADETKQADSGAQEQSAAPEEASEAAVEPPAEEVASDAEPAQAASAESAEESHDPATSEAETAEPEPQGEAADARAAEEESPVSASTDEETGATEGAPEEAAEPAQKKESSSRRSSRRSRSRRTGRRSSRSRSNGSEPPQEVQAEEADDEPIGRDAVEEVEQETQVDTLDGDDIEDAARRRAKLLRRYKIQEVIKRGQIMLVQVAKEERGNKGAALTTYLSLPGRYCVLMPNTARGGGISRKIGSSSDRKRLKQVLGELQIPDGMAVIVRTAGSERSKTEIRRDYDYLIRLWSEIRESTLQAQAPELIYEEGNIVKRAIRDLYTSDMQEILVEGEDGYKAAKAFMRNLMPSHARKVQLFKDGGLPLLQHHRIEHQLAGMFLPEVQLRSGGYLVINVTEALVAIDVNSGKATRERHIEETALKTNLEAAEEVARQLRLRDLAGLIVIDFIDMEENRHNRDVERRLKDAMKADRARIQLGRISPFGLLELSRQRLRPSLVETAMVTCPHCSGTGRLYSPETAAMSLLRAIAEEGGRRQGGEMVVTVPSSVALYLLNHKRAQMAREEERFGFTIRIEIDEGLSGLQHRIERIGGTRRSAGRSERGESQRSESQRGESQRGQSSRGESSRGESGRGEQKPRKTQDDTEQQEAPAQQADAEEGDEEQDEQGQKRRRRRGKRGGRRRSRGPEEAVAAAETNGRQDSEDAKTEETAEPDEAAAETVAVDDAAPDEAETDAVVVQVPIEVVSATAEAAGTESSPPNGQSQDDAAAAGPAEPSEQQTPIETTEAEPVILEASPDLEVPSQGDGEPQAAEEAEEPEEEEKTDPGFAVVTAPDPSQPKKRGWWNRLVR